MGDLTSLANVKQWLNINTPQSDTLLARLVTAQSAFFETLVNRKILRATYTDIFNGHDGDRVANKSFLDVSGAAYGRLLVGVYGAAVTLKRYPVLPRNVADTADTIVVTIDGGDGTGLLTPVPKATNIGQPDQTDGWTFHPDTAQIELIGFRFTTGVVNCSIRYDAGWDEVPADIEQAVIEMVSLSFKNRNRIGQTSSGVAGEQAVFGGSGMLPATVQAVIDTYRRVNV